MRHVSVRNFETYQHYTRRRPPWVKWYATVLDDEHFAGLSPNARLVYALMLLVASRRDNRIPNDPAWLAVEMSLPRSLIAKALAELLATEYLVGASNGASKVAPKVLLPETESREQRQRTTSNHHPELQDDGR